MTIQMVDLQGQYEKIKAEVDAAIHGVIDSAHFIRGPQVGEFECELAGYLGCPFVHGVANGTDALQIALMAQGVGPGDEVITTAFTFIATAEAAALLGATPVFADIDPQTFNIDPSKIEELITPRTKAIVPVHLFGLPADMDPILDLARWKNIPVIEDNAQGIGATYHGQKVGFMGNAGTLSFFPSKNLGCYGDGGAVMTTDKELYERMKMIANHGSRKKYHNEIVGVNSRLDSIQAAILEVKLRHLDAYIAARVEAAAKYDALLGDVDGITTPFRPKDVTHVFHQYTIRVDQNLNGGRDALSAALKEAKVPHAVYYPVALHQLEVFTSGSSKCTHGDMTNTVEAAAEVISLPMHTELTDTQIGYVADAVRAFAGKGSLASLAK